MPRASYCGDCGETHKPGQCKMVDNPKRGAGKAKCPHCGNVIDGMKRNAGHKETCKVIIDLEDPRTRRANPPRPSVKIPRHRGNWGRPGAPYLNSAKLRVRDYTCKTCGRTASAMDGCGEPSSWCPEVR